MARQVHLEDLNVGGAALCDQLSCQADVPSVALKADDAATARGQIERELTVAAAEVSHVESWGHVLVQQCQEGIFAVTGGDARGPTVREGHARQCGDRSASCPDRTLGHTCPYIAPFRPCRRVWRSCFMERSPALGKD